MRESRTLKLERKHNAETALGSRIADVWKKGNPGVGCMAGVWARQAKMSAGCVCAYGFW